MQRSTRTLFERMVERVSLGCWRESDKAMADLGVPGQPPRGARSCPIPQHRRVATEGNRTQSGRAGLRTQSGRQGWASRHNYAVDLMCMWMVQLDQFVDSIPKCKWDVDSMGDMKANDYVHSLLNEYR